MNDLIKWGGGGSLEPSRATKKAIKDIVEDGLKADIELAIDKELYLSAMEHVTDLDNYRHLLAQGNPELHAVLVRFELGFAASAERTIRDRNSPLKKMGF